MNVNEDTELVKRAIRGERRAFNEIVNKHKERVYYTAMKMVRNKDDAYDITQDVFISAYKNLDSFKGTSSLFTWLYRITVNTCLNFMNRDKFRGMASVSDIQEVSGSPVKPDEELYERELADRLDKAVKQLPPQQRTVFVMRYYDQMPHAEIAKTLNRSVGTIKVNYFQALKKLRHSFADLLSNELGQSLANEAKS